MTDTMDIDQARDNGRVTTYAKPGTTFSRVFTRCDPITNTMKTSRSVLEQFCWMPLNWHRFIIWDLHLSRVEADELYQAIREWCAANKVRRPSRKFIRGFAEPIMVGTASEDKALLFKMTFGGEA